MNYENSLSNKKAIRAIIHWTLHANAKTKNPNPRKKNETGFSRHGEWMSKGKKYGLNKRTDANTYILIFQVFAENGKFTIKWEKV